MILVVIGGNLLALYELIVHHYSEKRKSTEEEITDIEELLANLPDSDDRIEEDNSVSSSSWSLSSCFSNQFDGSHDDKDLVVVSCNSSESSIAYFSDSNSVMSDLHSSELPSISTSS